MRTGIERGWVELWESPPSLGTAGGFSGLETCIAWLGPWPPRAAGVGRGCVRARVCVHVCARVCARVRGRGGSCSLAAEPPHGPDLLLVLAALEAAAAPCARPQMWSAQFPPAGLWPPPAA